MAIPSRRINTPYVYLCKEGEGAAPYALYVCIYTYAGTVLTGSVVALPVIQFTVGGTPASNAVQPNFFRFDLANPPAGGPMDIPDVSVEVQKVREPQPNPYVPLATDPDPDKGGDREITVLYADADLNAKPAGQVAFNCPYVYLTNPAALEGMARGEEEQPISYAGRVIVPLQAVGYDPLQQPPLTQTPTGNPANGIQSVLLFTSAASTLSEVNPSHVDCNQKEYTDTNRQTGYFEVTVTFPQAAQEPEKKGKLRNRSSDTHPNMFIG